MNEAVEYYQDLKDLSKEKRRRNRDSARTILTDNGVQFTVHNNSAHLRVHTNNGVIDFWPGTGLWICPDGKRGRGIFKLLSQVKKGGCDK